MTATDRQSAKALGLAHYETGRPCLNGHLARRITGNGACMDCRKDAARAYRAKHPDTWRETNQKSRAANIEKVRERSREWSRGNPEKRRAVAQRYRARKRGAEGSYTHIEIADLHFRQRGKCANCKVSLKTGYHADHITPLVRGGSNWIANIQLLCAPCNWKKQGTDPLTWARREGRLV